MTTRSQELTFMEIPAGKCLRYVVLWTPSPTMHAVVGAYEKADPKDPDASEDDEWFVEVLPEGTRRFHLTYHVGETPGQALICAQKYLETESQRATASIHAAERQRVEASNAFNACERDLAALQDLAMRSASAGDLSVLVGPKPKKPQEPKPRKSRGEPKCTVCGDTGWAMNKDAEYEQCSWCDAGYAPPAHSPRCIWQLSQGDERCDCGRPNG